MPNRTVLTILILLPALFAAVYVLQRERAWMTAVEQTRAVFESTPPVPWQPPGHPFLDGQRLAMERTVTTVRLAIVEARPGDREAAANTWARAAQHAAAAHVQNPDPGLLRELARRLDETALRPDLP